MRYLNRHYQLNLYPTNLSPFVIPFCDL
uniref:Uncharacterized protein n=1 Tax=Arundo donax TaxID=35708 RepID=A0A0A9AN80_ARUDO